jgi:cystathionine beta-synthase
VPAQVLVKLEALNPGGSIKDRVGVAMVEEAERLGWLQPGGTIIEATAGNTGVGLALAASVKGYRCIFVLPDKMSGEKIRLLKAYGAEIVITPTAVAPDSPESYNGVADRLAREIPGAWRPNQFANLANPEIHYRSTGPEIWEQTGGKVTAFVSGVGTGGTISVVDEWIRIGDAESFHAARAMARREGLLVGGSSGTAVAAALRYAQRLGADDVVVALCPDTGRNYLSKFYDDAWLTQNHLHRGDPPAQTVGDLLRARGPRTLVTVASEATAAEAANLLQASGISQLPVLRDGRSVGSIQEVTLARLLHDDLDPDTVSVGEVMARPLPQLDVGVQLVEAYRLLMAGNSGVLALDGEAVVDIITRIDLIQYWTRRRQG